MDMFECFKPQNMIDKITSARTQERSLTSDELWKLRDLLYCAEQDDRIIRVARGEGRSSILNPIASNDDILFGWGMKAQHSLYKESAYRNFLEPGCVDAENMCRIIIQYENAISYRMAKHFPEYAQDARRANNRYVQRLLADVDRFHNEPEQLELIKDWLCTVLQTSGDIHFRKVSPWISASLGEERYKTAYFFGGGRTSTAGRPQGNYIKKRFVILDAWVRRDEEHFAFERTADLIAKLNRINLPWYEDRHHEIMMKYAIYPHNLIGYYYFEDDHLLHYRVNPHYLNAWTRDPFFRIGDYVHIDQDLDNLPTDNPYRLIYSRLGDRFSVVRRVKPAEHEVQHGVE